MRLPVFGTLGRYLARQNLFLMAVCLGVGVGIYLLSDLFDRVDDFISAGLGLAVMLRYFAVKLPVILSQILPAVFLLALVAQLGLLSRSRELLALRAGGLSPAWFVRFFVIYAVFWSLVQFTFSQVVGIYGEHEATRIWKEDVRKKQLDKLSLKDLWFRDGSFIVEVGEASLAQNRATDITVYVFDPDSQRLLRILKAKEARVLPDGWNLLDLTSLDTATFQSTEIPAVFLPMRQDLKAFAVVDPSEDRSQLPMWQLSKVISELRQSGSNVERLRTVWHSRISYAFSIAVMALVALALLTWSENLYLNIGLAMLLVFLQYGTHAVGLTAGQKGSLPPLVGAWLGNLVFGGLAGARLAWVSLPDVRRKVRARLANLPLPGRRG